ncbi:hypothetical protein EOE48_28345, partial [Methylobacterium oryzihabitans]
MTPVDAKLTDLVRRLDRASGRGAGDAAGDPGAFGSLLGALGRDSAAPDAEPADGATVQVPAPPAEEGAAVTTPADGSSGRDELGALMERAAGGRREREPAPEDTVPPAAGALPAVLLALAAPASAQPATPSPAPGQPDRPVAVPAGAPVPSEPVRITVLTRETHFAPVQYGLPEPARPVAAQAGAAAASTADVAAPPPTPVVPASPAMPGPASSAGAAPSASSADDRLAAAA